MDEEKRRMSSYLPVLTVPVLFTAVLVYRHLVPAAPVLRQQAVLIWRFCSTCSLSSSISQDSYDFFWRKGRAVPGLLLLFVVVSYVSDAVGNVVGVGRDEL